MFFYFIGFFQTIVKLKSPPPSFLRWKTLLLDYKFVDDVFALCVVYSISGKSRPWQNHAFHFQCRGEWHKIQTWITTMRTRSRYYPPLRDKSLKRSTGQMIQAEALKLSKSGEQFDQLNKRIAVLQKRFNSARENKCRGLCYSLKLRLAVAEAVRNVYLEYARLKLEEVARLERLLWRHIAFHGNWVISYRT